MENNKETADSSKQDPANNISGDKNENNKKTSSNNLTSESDNAKDEGAKLVDSKEVKKANRSESKKRKITLHVSERKMGKRLKAQYKEHDKSRIYEIKEAVELIKSRSEVNFDETVEVILMLGIDVKQADQSIRGSVVMPSGLGRQIRVAVFAKDEKADEAKEAGADIVGLDELIATVKKGEINFDMCIATPDVMQKITEVAKILGPKKLMPNPKLGYFNPSNKRSSEKG